MSDGYATRNSSCHCESPYDVPDLHTNQIITFRLLLLQLVGLILALPRCLFCTQ
jgi:hypothetical protein